MAVLDLKVSTKNDESADKTVSAFSSFFMPILRVLRMCAWYIGHLFAPGRETLFAAYWFLVWKPRAVGIMKKTTASAVSFIKLAFCNIILIGNLSINIKTYPYNQCGLL